MRANYTVNGSDLDFPVAVLGARASRSRMKRPGWTRSREKSCFHASEVYKSHLNDPLCQSVFGILRGSPI